MSERVWKPIPAPPEVVLDHHFHQVVAFRDNGEPFMQYVPCSVCGWLIGCGDAIDSITHESCAAPSTPNPEPRDG